MITHRRLRKKGIDLKIQNINMILVSHHHIYEYNVDVDAVAGSHGNYDST